MRAGWRLLIYLLFVGIFAGAEILLMIALRLPHLTHSGFTAPDILLQEGIGTIAALAAAAIMALLEGRSFGAYGLPVAAAFGSRFWHGVVWGLVMITAMILLIRTLGGFSFGDLALHGTALWRYAGALGRGISVRGVFRGIFVSRLHAIHAGHWNWILACGLDTIGGIRRTSSRQ